MSATISPYDIQEATDDAVTAHPHLLAAAILLIVLAVACALQTFGAPTAAPTPTFYTACLRADGSLYGLAEGPSPALPCSPGDATVQATLARDWVQDWARDGER